MQPRLRLQLPVLLAALLAPLATIDVAVGVDDQPSPTRTLVDVRVINRIPTPRADSGTIKGFDGKTYDRAPVAVQGRGEDLFFGPDFDLACALGGPRFLRAAKELARVADVIERSGRTVVWTMAPNKSAPLRGRLIPAQFPHGKCDRKGLAAQTRTLRTLQHPTYLSMVKPLAKSKRQVYWRTDPHWSTVGGAVFAKSLAQRLDPKIAKIQRSSYGTETGIGALNLLRDLEIEETLERAFPATKVQVTPRPGPHPWSGYPDSTYDHSWTTAPARKTIPGRTLIIGDSFGLYALESLRPLFRDGRWMWFAHVALQDVVKAVKQSDTVVLEVFQLFVPGTIVASKKFRNHLAKTLGVRA